MNKIVPILFFSVSHKQPPVSGAFRLGEDGRYVALVDLPGVEPAHIRVEQLGRGLWVRVLDSDVTLRLVLPADADRDQLAAKVKNGRLALSAPQLQPRLVEVVVG